MTTVEIVKFATLPTAEQEAIRSAEKEAADFYGNIETEENENLRMADLWKSCSIMVLDPIFAVSAVTAHLKESGLFTATEEAAILKIATIIKVSKINDINGDSVDHKAHSHAYNWTHTVSRLYKDMRAGYYTDDVTCSSAGLIARIK